MDAHTTPQSGARDAGAWGKGGSALQPWSCMAGKAHARGGRSWAATGLLCRMHRVRPCPQWQ
eukprot:6056016-Prymnesium_polylepis.1